MQGTIKHPNVLDEIAVKDKRIAELEATVEDLCIQFGYDCDNPPGVMTGGLGALECAFAALGWSDPHPTPALACDEPGCGKVATCGFPAEARYRRTCGDHYRPKEK